MKLQSAWICLLLATLTLSSCRLLFGPNKVNLRWLPDAHRTTVEGEEAWESSTTFESYFEEIRFRGLQKNKTYCFWISTPRLGNGSFASIKGQSRDNRDSLFYRSLELTLYDRRHREMKYNDDWTSLWTDGSDTLAMVRLRTTDEIPSDTLYLRVSACGNPLVGARFEMHVTVYDNPDLSKHGMAFGMDALEPQAVDPVFASNYKTKSQRNECKNECTCDTLVISDGDISTKFQLAGIDSSRIGAAYESGTGFPIRKERCACDPTQVDDRLECMLHNFRLFWFKPPVTGVYMISLEDVPDAKAEKKAQGLDSIGIAVFSDEGFKIPGEIDKADLKDLVADRLMKICEDIIVGVRMVGSGKYLEGRPNRIVVGASESQALGNGLLLGRDSTYYIAVTAPMFQPFQCKLNVRLQTSQCDPNIPTIDPSNPPTNEYDFQSPLAQSTCNPYASPSRDEVATLQDHLPHLKMESQWMNYCWYDIQGTDAEGLDFEVSAAFEGKLAIYTYGDAHDYTTYTVVKQQLFGFSTQPDTVKFTLAPVPSKRYLRLLIAHNAGTSGAIHIRMTERITLIAEE